MIKHVCAGLTALFFAALSLQAENKVVKLPRVVATNTASVEIKQIELSDTATVLDMGAWYRPHYWIRISKDTYLRGDDGKKYPVRFGSGIKLDTEFWMPDSGTASFKLHFPALPKSSVTDTPRASALASITLESRGLIKTDHFLWLLTRISPILGSSSVLDMTPLSTLTHPCLARGAFG